VVWSQVKAAAQAAAKAIVRRGMVSRHANGMASLLAELDALKARE